MTKQKPAPPITGRDARHQDIHLGYIETILQNLTEKRFLTKDNPMTDNVAYTSIDDYKAKTGRRFRMTRVQKQSGMSREQAFQEFVQNLNTANNDNDVAVVDSNNTNQN